jgi:hypothetical protein
MSSKVRFYLLVIHPQVSHSMDIWAWARTQLFLFLTLSIISLVLMLPKIVLGQAEQHFSLCVNMISCLYSTEQLIQPYTSEWNFCLMQNNKARIA